MSVREILSRRPVAWGGVAYWIIFFAILTLGIAYRAIWTNILLVPFVTDDTHSYLFPMVSHPWAPFSEYRTPGTSFVFLIGISAVQSPTGILIANHALWLTSSVILTLSIRRFLGLGVLSLMVLFYLTFNARGLTAEYFAMSEHLSRVMFAFYAAAALATWQRPRSIWLAVLLAALTIGGIFAKGSALILLPATFLLYAFHAVRLRKARLLSVLAAGATSIAVMLLGLAGYMTSFNARYNQFALTTTDGPNFFSHAAHLINLDGPAYPDLKRELGPILTVYRDKYVANGLYEPNWLIYGTLSPRVIADFGTVTPASLVQAYAARNGITTDKIYFDLVVEGVIAHPFLYAAHVWTSLQYLLTGYNYIYYRILPSPEAFDEHRTSTRKFREHIFIILGKPVTDCESARGMRSTAHWVLKALMSDQVLGCAPAPYESDHEVQELSARVQAWYAPIGNGIVRALAPPPLWVGVVAVVLLWPGWHGARARRITFFGAFFAMCAAGYVVLLAMFNTAEPARFMMNIQDYPALTIGFVVAALMVTCRRGLLRLTCR